MKLFLLLALICLHLSCAGAKAEIPSSSKNSNLSHGSTHSRSAIPNDIKKFCQDQCMEDVNGIPMFVRECYDECVKDLMEKQGTWKQLWRLGVSQSNR